MSATATNPAVTPATGEFYAALAAIRTLPITVSEPIDPYDVERWALAELEAVAAWRRYCHQLVAAAARGPETWRAQRSRIIGFVAVWMVDQKIGQETGEAMVRDLMAAIDQMAGELSVLVGEGVNTKPLRCEAAGHGQMDLPGLAT